MSLKYFIMRCIYLFKHNYYVNKEYHIKMKNKLSIRVLFHDLDKIILMLVYPNISSNSRQEIHRLTNKHHILYMNKTKNNIMDSEILEMICDWESCRYSKSYKKLTSREYYEFIKDYITNEYVNNKVDIFIKKYYD